jgi:hypothetical protein
MKQYTNSEQTAKLIELGFEKPRIDAGVTKWEGYEPICTGSYTLGELIEMLPKIYPKITTPYCFEIGFDTNNYIVRYTYDNGYIEVTSAVELVDALYDMMVKLKEEGVI